MSDTLPTANENKTETCSAAEPSITHNKIVTLAITNISSHPYHQYVHDININLTNMNTNLFLNTPNENTTQRPVNRIITLPQTNGSGPAQIISIEHTQNSDMHTQKGATNTATSERHSNTETITNTTGTTPGDHNRRSISRKTQRSPNQTDDNHIDPQRNARNTAGSNTRTMPPTEKHSKGPTKNDETDNVIVCRRRKDSMLDQVSDDDDFEDERRTTTKSDGIGKDKAYRRQKHSMPDQTNDDDDFEDEPPLPKGRDRKGNGRQE